MGAPVMTITFPITNLLDLYPISPTGYNFRLHHRQEQSRTAGGRTIVKDFGPPLWLLDASTGMLPHADAIDFEAMLASMNNGIGTFLAWDLRRAFPAAHSLGDFDDSATILSLGANNKSLRLTGLFPGFQLSRGDYLSITFSGHRYLHQILEPATVMPDGSTSFFEVTPHFQPGTVAGASVVLKKPSAVMALVPNSIQTQVGALHTSISFQACEAF